MIAEAVAVALLVADSVIAVIRGNGTSLRDNANVTTTNANVAANHHGAAPGQAGGSGNGCYGPLSGWEVHTATATVTITSRATDLKRLVFSPSFRVLTDAGAQHLCSVDSPNPSSDTQASWGWVRNSSCVVPIPVSADRYAATHCNASFVSFYPVTDAVTLHLRFYPGTFTASSNVSGLNNADVVRLRTSYL